MAVDSNFERLEEKLNRFVEVLAQLQQENAALKGQIEQLQSESIQLRSDNERLQTLESEYQQGVDGREEVKDRIENLLAKLDAVNL